MRKKQHKSITVVFLLGLVLALLITSHAARTEESPAPASAFPEGSSSVIESLTWRVAGSDPTTLHQQAKALVGQIAEAVLVKESETLLVFSLPTQKLPSLRQELSKLGSVSAPDEATPTAPTTLLRLMFVRS